MTAPANVSAIRSPAVRQSAGAEKSSSIIASGVPNSAQWT